MRAAKSDASLDLRVGVEDLTWRGASWSDARLTWQTGAPAALQATGPGEARIEILATPQNGGWRGKARLKAEDFAAFAAALHPDAAGAGAQAKS